MFKVHAIKKLTERSRGPIGALGLGLLIGLPAPEAGARAVQVGLSRGAPSDCPAGVDPSYCEMAKATGGSVSTCDRDNPGLCLDQMAAQMRADELRRKKREDTPSGRARAEASKREAERASQPPLTPEQSERIRALEGREADRIKNRRLTLLIASIAWVLLWPLPLGAWAAIPARRREWRAIPALALGAWTLLGSALFWFVRELFSTMGLIPFHSMGLFTLGLGLLCAPAAAVSWAAFAMGIDASTPWPRRLRNVGLIVLAGLAATVPWIFILFGKMH